MEIYEPEEQQVEAIKRFLKNMALLLVLQCLLSFLVGGIGIPIRKSQHKKPHLIAMSYSLKRLIPRLLKRILFQISSHLLIQTKILFAVLASLHAAKALIDKGNLVDGAKQLFSHKPMLKKIV